MIHIIIKTDRISTNYVLYSDKIKDYCDGFTIDDRQYEIEDFVREAMVEMEDCEFLTEPK